MEYTGERFVPSKDLMSDETAFEHLHRYHHAREIVKGKVVLDIACGEGYGSFCMAQNAKLVYGVDIDKSCIEHASKKYSAKNIEFLQGDVSEIPLPDKCVDIVVSFETIEHLDEKKQLLFLKEVKRVLVKNGKLIISTPDKNNYSQRYSYENKFHVKEFTKQEFCSLLGSHFTDLVFLGQRYEIIDAITPDDLQDLSAAKISNWQQAAKPFVPKYLLSICCDGPIEKEFLHASVVFQVSKDYWQITDRIVEMEKHILELGSWGRRLDKEIEEKNVLLLSQRTELEDLYKEREDQLTALKKISFSLEHKNDAIELFGRKFQETTDKVIELQSRLMEQSEWIKKFHYELLEKDELLHHKVKELDSLYLERKVWSEEGEQIKKELKAALEAKNELEATAERFSKQVGRLQQNIHELNQFRIDANQQLDEKYILLTQQSDAIISLKHTHEENVAAIKKLDSENRDKKQIIEEQKEQIDNLYLQLQVVNRRLAEIYQSDGWKFLNSYYHIKGKLLPEGSKRYLRLKTIVNKIRGRKEPAIYFNATKNLHLLSDTGKTTVFEPIEFPVFESPCVSIVIPAYNGWALTYKCLESIKENTFDVAYEIIIGDDASTDETKNINQYVKNIVVIRNEKNLEFLHNCNHAASFAKGKYILFLNNDTEVRPRWLSSMVDLMEKDGKIGMTGSKLIYPNGRLQEAGAIIWEDASGWNFGLNQDPEAPEYNYVKEVDYISGASIIIRSDLWGQIGGFDKRYTPAYCEDSDLAFEVRKRGYKVVYQPLSEVIHFEGYTHGTDLAEGIKGSEIKAYQKLNNEKFRQKWKQVLETEHLPNGQNVFWARDKSQNKKTILVIDHYVPHYDKDAGSKTVFQYLKLFVSLNMNVKFMGDNFFRHEPYTTVLQQLGIEVLYGPDYARNWQQWVLNNHDKFDFILLNRPHISKTYIDFLRENTEAKIIYYGHDLHFVRLTRQYEIEGKKELLKEAANWKEVEISLFSKSDVVLVPSIDEKNLITDLGIKNNVQIITPYIFERAATPINDFSDRKDILFIGGFTHVPNIDGVLWFAREIWPLVKTKIANAKFIIAGSNAPAEINLLAGDDIDVLGFVTDEALQKLYGKVKLVVIPLRYGAGVKGKTVEAMYYGVPIVSTKFGIEGLPQADLHGFLKSYDDAETFARRLTDMYGDVNLLREMSKEESTYINSHFRLEAAARSITSILEINKFSNSVV